MIGEAHTWPYTVDQQLLNETKKQNKAKQSKTDWATGVGQGGGGVEGEGLEGGRGELRRAWRTALCVSRRPR